MQFTLNNFTAVRYKEKLFSGSLTVEGSGFCLLGASHSGKTPFALALCGGEPATGEAYLGDLPLHTLSAKERNCGMLFGARTIFRGTVKENIAKGLLLRGENRESALKKAEEESALLGLTEILDIPAKKCDFLTAQKVAFLRLTVREPRLIVMDFPVRGDSAEELQFLSSAQKIAKDKGIFLILCTQNARHAALFSQVAVVEQGKITAFGKRTRLLSLPPTPAAGKLLCEEYNQLYAVVSDGFFTVGGQKIAKVSDCNSPNPLPCGEGACLLFCYENAFALGEDVRAGDPFSVGEQAPIRVRVDYSERLTEEELRSCTDFSCSDTSVGASVGASEGMSEDTSADTQIQSHSHLYRYYLDFDPSGKEEQGKITRFTVLSPRIPKAEDTFLTVTALPCRLHAFAFPAQMPKRKKDKDKR